MRKGVGEYLSLKTFNVLSDLIYRISEAYFRHLAFKKKNFFYLFIAFGILGINKKTFAGFI